MLLDEIKKANINAIKTKDAVARSMFSVLLNKTMLENIKKREKGEELNDADVVQILQKFIKELTEEKENYQKVGNTEETTNLERQIEIAKTFLPQMMSKEQIKEEILKLADRTIPTVMKHFKANFAGKCDMRDVQEVLKSL